MPNSINTKEIYSLLTDYLNKKRKYGKIEKYLDEGESGIIYTLTKKDILIKITESFSELPVAKAAKSKNIKYFPYYYELDSVNRKNSDNKYYVIVMEEITPLEEIITDYDALDQMDEIIIEMQEIFHNGGDKKEVENVIKHYKKKPYEFFDKNTNKETIKNIFKILINIKDYIFDFKRKTGITLADLHGGNMGFNKENKFIFFDLKSYYD